MIGSRVPFDPRLRLVAEVVRKNIADPQRLSLASAARIANVTPEHFCRLFRAHTGMSFSEWQSAYRMEYAKDLLLDRWMSIAGVGMAVGYDHASTFARVFKRYEGVSPRSLRPFAAAYPELADALRRSKAWLVMRVGPLICRSSSVTTPLERLAERLGELSRPYA